VTAPEPRRRARPAPASEPEPNPQAPPLPPRRRSTFNTCAPQGVKPAWLLNAENAVNAHAERWEDGEGPGGAGISRAWWWLPAHGPDGNPIGFGSLFIREYPMRSLQFEVDVAAMMPPTWDRVPVGGYAPPAEVPEPGALPGAMRPEPGRPEGTVSVTPWGRTGARGEATRPVARLWIHGVEPLRLTLARVRPWEWAVQAYTWETGRAYYPAR